MMKKILISLAIIVAVAPTLVLPFYGWSLGMALFANVMWIGMLIGASPFLLILVGFGMAFAAAFAGVPFHTDTAEASIQRARLLDRGYTEQYYRPARPLTSYNPTWDQKRPYYLSNYPTR